jgi:pimeloyl-ACP methyl ester carboxylesterase
MDELSRLALPTLVLIGEDEVPYLQIVARTLAYYLPGAGLTVIPGGGHMVNMTVPDAYNSTVAQFLEKVPG